MVGDVDGPGLDGTPPLVQTNADGQGEACLIHTFDTDRRDLQRSGLILELHERRGSLIVVAGRSGRERDTDATMGVQAQIDGSWAVEILSGCMSPMAALDRRLGQPGPRLVAELRAAIGDRQLQRVHSRVAQPISASSGDPADAGTTASYSAVRSASQATVIQLPPRPALVG